MPVATHRYLTACMAFCLGLLSLAAAAETRVTVMSADDLADALKGARGGTAIELSPGDYGALELRGLAGSPDAPISLQAADPQNPPRFTRLTVRDARNIQFDRMHFDYRYQTGDKSHVRPFQIIGSEGIAIQNALFDGDLAVANPGESPAPTAFGLTITSSRGVSVTQSEFRRFYRGMVTDKSEGITLIGNTLHDLRMDGLNFSQVRGVLIEGNTIRSFARVVDSPDHADFIQFWTNGTNRPSRDIVIRGNILNSGDGWYTQSIFMRNDQVDRGLADRDMYYRNVLIEDNVIINAHLHGITIGETDGLIIRNNSVIRNARSEGADDNPALWTPQIRVAPASTNVTIVDNVTSKVEGFADQSDWKVENNLSIQDRDPERPGYYDRVFVDARTGDPSRLENFAPLPGGPLDGTGFGSSILAKLAGTSRSQSKTANSSTQTTAPNADLLSLDADADTLTMLSRDQPVAVAHPSIAKGVLRLASGDPPLIVPSDVISPLLGAHDFVLSFRLRGSGSYRHPGNVLTIPKTLAVSVTGRGALNLDITDSDGMTLNVRSPGRRLYDATWHEVAVLFSGKRQTVSLVIDGETVAERPFKGLAGHGKWNLTFGSPTKDGMTFLGELSALRLTVNTE